ncbi:MAG TPA: TIGR03621 family F420-dependent LLM class oxidoreductase [Acidimicrobiia bacterium]|nr:TIGR03621 family F420-dependent LLM class oxidoreductase [Acidimicrobiia bacterium]
MKPFRFGVTVSQVGSAAEWRDKARKIEDLGYATLFMPDHFGEELAPLPAIAMAAAHTTTLRIGSLMFDNDYKHPAILAKEAATIDLLSDGRLELGIGAGWMRTDYDQLGLPYDPPAVRVDRFEEALHIIKQCFTGEQFTYHGEHYRVTGYASWPKPVQQPGPPLLIGGGGRRVLSIAAQKANIVGINPNLRAGEIGLDAARDSLREQTDRKVQWIRDAAGPRIDDIEIQMRFFITRVTADRMKLAEALAPSFGVSPEEALESGAALVGTEDEIAEQLHRRRAEWGLSYVVIGDDNVDAFAPIVAKLAGT